MAKKPKTKVQQTDLVDYELRSPQKTARSLGNFFVNERKSGRTLGVGPVLPR
jgi:hypothetical protein